MKVEREEVREWLRAVLTAHTKDAQDDQGAQRQELTRQASLLVAQQDRLLNVALTDGIDQDTFAAKSTQLRDRLTAVKLQLDVVDRSQDETADLAHKVFELSQTPQERWLTTEYAVKRRIFELACLICRLDGETLVPELRKPFDALADGLLSKESRLDEGLQQPSEPVESRNGRGEETAIELLVRGVQGWPTSPSNPPE